MAVVGHAYPLFDGQTATFSNDKTEITCQYRVEVNNALDGPNIVRFAVGIPLIGAIYIFGNDVNPLLTCTEVSPQRMPGSRLQWLVTAKYSSPNFDDNNNSSQTNDQGKKEKDPEKWHEEIEVSFSPTTGPLGTAIFTGPKINHLGYPGRTTPEIGDVGPVRNSAGEIVSPPLERDFSRIVIKITQNVKKFPTELALKYADSINDKLWTINKRNLGFFMKVPQRCAKLRSISGKLTFQEDIPYFPTTYEFEILPGHIDDKQDWRFRQLDSGFNELVRTGDLDKNGKTIIGIGASPQLRPITDAHGDPITEMVPLNGQGRPLSHNIAGGSTEPVYLEYMGYKELPFNLLPV